MTDNHFDESALEKTWAIFEGQHHCSVDRMVCDPSLRDGFVQSAMRVCGTTNEFTILWTLMRMRKRKLLGTTGRRAPSGGVPVASTSRIDTLVLKDIWTMFKREHDCSVDRMVCDPKLRNDFLQSARRVCGTQDEFTILWALMQLRKRKELKATG